MTRISYQYPIFFIAFTLILLKTTSGQNFPTKPGEIFNERYRPQFHYTVVKGWINDPIGLVYYNGEYHLFNDHNPFSTNFPGGKRDGEQSHWSHAISTDLVHWEHLPIAVYPDGNGACWSGSGLVDWNNTSGFQQGEEPPLVLVYTSAGKTFTQSLVYSNDRGRTWEKFDNNPVLKQIAPENRDPNVFWHEPTKKWVMVLFVEEGIASFFNSDDLKTWSPTGNVSLPGGFHECPDLFELPVDGDMENKKWVLYDARFFYWIGSFDGKTFKPELGPFKGDLGKNFYAAQSWRNTDNKQIQIGWMNGGHYPGMPFNQQMSFPCELSLRNSNNEIRLYRYPVKEIEKLYDMQFEINDKIVKSGENLLSQFSGELFDIQMEIEPGGDTPEFRISLYNEFITVKRQTNEDNGYIISTLGNSADVALINGKIKLRILVDRTSIEVFVNDGELSMSSCFLTEERMTVPVFFARGEDIHIISLKVSKMKSIWGAESATGK